MFFGTTPAPVRDYLASEIRRIAPARVFEPCAGNFVLSLVCGAIDPKIQVISGDVSLYSVAIGHAFANQDGGIRLKDEWLEKYPYFKGKTSPQEIGAAIIYWAELAKHLGKQHVKYYQSLVRDLNENVDRYMSGILSKIERARETLGNNYRFVAQDAAVSIQEAEKGDFVLYDPPYYMGDYEKEYEALCKCFDFPEIPYTEITPELKNTHLKELAVKGTHTFFRCEEVPEIPSYEVVFDYLYKANGKKYFVLSNSNCTPAQGWKTVMPTKKARFDVLWNADLTADSKIQIIPVEGAIGNHYRLLWTKKALMRDAGEKFLLTADGKVCGVISIMSAEQYGHTYACLIADAAPLNTPYRRLGKLVLHAILNDEFLESINRKFLWQHEGFTTQAYTDSPVSMKYRGLFELIDRKQQAPSGHKFALTYRANKFKWKTIQEAYDAWFKRYGSELIEEKT